MIHRGRTELEGRNVEFPHVISCISESDVASLDHKNVKISVEKGKETVGYSLYSVTLFYRFRWD
jgi:hypothetical protein